MSNIEDHLKTIREARDLLVRGDLLCEIQASTLLDQAIARIEKMVSEQKPVAWVHEDDPERVISAATKAGAEKDGGAIASTTKPYSIPAFAAPVAQQYEAGDMASASAQGFRDGVASVQQGQEPVAWLVCSVNSDGSLSLEHAAAWKEAAHEHINDAITEHGIEEAASWVVRPAYVAAPVAQQPQARPDFTDEWTGYLKDGETPFERFLRERKDLQSLLKLYQRVLEENERLKAQQPQAETDNHEARGQIEFLDKKNNALLAAIRKVMARLADLLDEDQFKEIEEIVSFAGVQPQAEAVREQLRAAQVAATMPLIGPLLDAWDGLPNDLKCAEELSNLRKQIGEINMAMEGVQPQQAEAVPSDVVRDAERYRWLRDQTTDDGIAIVMKNKCINDSISYAENINKHLDAAIAQQKGSQ